MKFKYKPIKYIVTETGCHECVSHVKNDSGYPCIRREMNGKSKNITVAKYLWIQKYGLIPSKLEICHTCDNPACINIDHLWAGTHLENTKDMMTKNRHIGYAIGEQNINCKLTKDKIKLIRNDKRIGKEIALEYGVTQANISLIKKGQTWRHVI
jgi:hypothetical protein